MQLLNAPLRGYFSLRKKRIESIRNQSQQNQKKWLGYFTKNGSETSFGKDHYIQEKMPYNEFADAVPVHNYNTLFPYIERVMKGEPNVLWNTPIHWIAKSSGTTESKSKFIPVSRESLWKNNYLSAQDTLTAYMLLFPKNHFFSGKGLALGGCFQEMPPDSPVQIGDISAVLLKNMPKIGDIVKASNRNMLLHNDWNEKLPGIAKSCYRQNVTSISGVPSWMLLILKEVLELSGKNNIKEVWPNLELFMHGGVAFAPYIEEYKRLIPGDSTFYMNMYNASEGFFGFQDQIENDDLLLLTDNTVFYEFIPVSEVGILDQKPVPLTDVRVGENYAIVITTAGGLWRYVIGDTIHFTSTEPYRFQITGRTMHYINAFGEELIVDNADKSLYKACEATGAVISEYTAAPIFLDHNQKEACHEWVIEFSVPPDNLQRFATILDETLQSLNSDYETKRINNLILHQPLIHVAPKGTFVRWLATKNHLGGQHKVPRLQNDRKVIEEILSF